MTTEIRVGDLRGVFGNTFLVLSVEVVPKRQALNPKNPPSAGLKVKLWRLKDNYVFDYEPLEKDNLIQSFTLVARSDED